MVREQVIAWECVAVLVKECHLWGVLWLGSKSLLQSGSVLVMVSEYVTFMGGACVTVVLRSGFKAKQCYYYVVGLPALAQCCELWCLQGVELGKLS